MRSFPSPKWNSSFGILPDTRRQLSYHLRFKLKNEVWSYYTSLFLRLKVMMLGWPNEYYKSRSSIWVFDLFQASAAGASIVLYRLYMCHSPLQLIFGGKHFSSAGSVEELLGGPRIVAEYCKLLGPHRWRRQRLGKSKIQSSGAGACWSSYHKHEALWKCTSCSIDTIWTFHWNTTSPQLL